MIRISAFYFTLYSILGSIYFTLGIAIERYTTVFYPFLKVKYDKMKTYFFRLNIKFSTFKSLFNVNALTNSLGPKIQNNKISFLSIPGIGKLDDLLQRLLPSLFSTTCQSSGNSRLSFDIVLTLI